MKFPELFYCKLHTCVIDSLLRGFTLGVLPLSSSAYSPMMLPLFETILELVE